jgi:uncharacterized protein YndB with AHSA1/START domain
MTPSEPPALRLQRTFAGSPDEVFSAWTSPDVLERWWAAGPSWTAAGCEVDPRPGSRYRLRMRNDESGAVNEVGGEYREVDRPHRLVYTWRWEGDGHTSLVTVEFHPDGDGTSVVLEHTALESEDSRAQHAAGWQGTLDSLARCVFDKGAV